VAYGPGREPDRRRIAKALTNRKVLDGIAKAVERYAKGHIASGKGRGPNGEAVPLQPLKDLQAEYWTTKKPKEGILATRQTVVMSKVRGKIVPRTVTEYLVRGSSYRAGGQPLRDTGELIRSLKVRAEHAGGTQVTVIIQGPLYGIYHELGFETDGPNYIPLTRKGVRSHSTGNNPNAEGLNPGKDFLMAWNGVKVPARPFMVPTNTEWSEIGRSIRLGLARVLKGKT